MRNDRFDFDLEDILAEFNTEPEDEPLPKDAAPPENEPEPVSEEPEPSEEPAAETPEPLLVMDPMHTPPEEPESVPPEEPASKAEEPSEAPPEEPKAGKKKKKKNKRKDEPEEDDPAEPAAPAAKAAAKVAGGGHKDRFIVRLSFGFLSLIFALASLICLAWSVQNIHPEATNILAIRGESVTNMVERMERSVYNSKASALSDIAYIRKQYSIPEEALVAPAPNAACYGTVSNENAQEVLEVIQKARDSGLLDGQDVIFDPNVSFYYDSQIQYYCDDTILVICWKELIDGFTCSCCEVKIADASQFRRKITEDSFGSPLRVFASELSDSVNAVVAMNADFYMFRDFGIMVYDRKLYRMDDSQYTGMYKKYNCVDTCFVTEEGDMLFTHRLEERTWQDMLQYIDDNKVLFSISFGPVLVENGVLQECDWYPAGEINNGYSRAGIGQAGKLHYFYMSLNHSPEREARWTVNQFAREMYNKGLINAYCLDGGQTSEIVFRGQPYNYIDFGAERGVSDIIYFATAIPESEVTK